jgi:hypothetical protein
MKGHETEKLNVKLLKVTECSTVDFVLNGWMGIMKARIITLKNTSKISVKQEMAISVNLPSAWTLK